MYFDGPLFIADEVLLAISFSTFLTLACRQPKPRFGVTDQPAFWIPNGTAEFRVVRAIAPHPRLSQPGLANAQKIGRLLWSQHTVTAVRLPRRFDARLERLAFFHFSRHCLSIASRGSAIRGMSDVDPRDAKRPQIGCRILILDDS